MTDKFDLGFSFDTSGLLAGSAAAERLTASFGQMGQAAAMAGQKAAQAAQQTAAGVSQAIPHLAGAASNMGVWSGATAQATTATQKLAASWSQAGGSAQTMIAGLLGANNSLRDHIPAANGAGEGLRRFLATIGMTSTGLAGFHQMLGVLSTVLPGVGTAVAGLFSAGALLKMAEAQDYLAQTDAKLKNALGSTNAASRAFEQLSASSRAAGISLQSTIDAFTRMSRSRDQIGATQEEVLQLTETVQKLGIISGASAGEVGSGMLQLGQALASGRLNGDELRSIMENMPALARAIADGMNITVGQMRALGAAGQLTADKVFAAILTQTEKTRKEFETMPDTVAKASTRFGDASMLMLGNLGKALNASQGIAGAINLAAAAAQKLGDALKQGINADQIANEIKKLSDKLDEGKRRAGGMTSPEGDAIPSKLATQGRRLSPEDRAKATAQQQTLIDRSQRIDDEDMGNYIKDVENKFSASASRGVTIANEIDDVRMKAKKLSEQAVTLKDGIAGYEFALRNAFTSTAKENAQKGIDELTAALAINDEQVRQNITTMAKMRQGTADLATGAAKYGFGAGASMFSKATEMSRQERLKVGPAAASADSFFSALQSDAAAQEQGGIADMNRQSEQQLRMAAAVGKGSDAMREQEIQNKKLEFQMSKFGLVLGRDATKALADYEAALRQAKKAEDENTIAMTNKNLDQQIADQEGLTEATKRGAAAEREYTLQIQARQYAESIGADADADAVKTFIEKQRALQAAGDRTASAKDIRGMQSQLNVQQQVGSVFGSPQDRARRIAEISKENELREQGNSLTEDEIGQQSRLAGELAAVNVRQQEWATTASDFTHTIGQGFENAILKGESLRSTLGALAQDLARIALRVGVTKPMENMFTGLIGNMFGASAPLQGPSLSGAPIGHTGGIPGVEGAHRLVSSDMFYNAPRFHSGRAPGLGSGEIPAIIKDDEGVFTPAQMRALGGRRGGGGPTINNEFKVTVNVGGGGGGSGGGKTSSEQAKMIGEAVSGQLEEMVNLAIGKQLRNGGLLNPGVDR
jgi:tape measure domain-containing protein